MYLRSGLQHGEKKATEKAENPLLPTRTPGHRAESDLFRGYHQAQGPGQMEIAASRQQFSVNLFT
jgi:hypothetical protein